MDEMTAGMIETTGLDRDTVLAWMNAVWGPDSVQARASQLGGALNPTGDYWTTRAWRAAQFPAANMFADARSLARMYAATVRSVDGVRLLDPVTVERMTVVRPPRLRRIGRLRRPRCRCRLRRRHESVSFRVGEPRASNLAAAVKTCLT